MSPHVVPKGLNDLIFSLSKGKGAEFRIAREKRRQKERRQQLRAWQEERWKAKKTANEQQKKERVCVAGSIHISRKSVKCFFFFVCVCVCVFES